MIERWEGIKRALATPQKELVSPSPLSIWINEQRNIPFRRKLANLVEDVKCAGLAPLILARGIAQHHGIDQGVILGGIEIGTPIIVGVSVGFVSENPLLGALAGAATYFAEGYALYGPRAKHIAANYRQVLNSS